MDNEEKTTTGSSYLEELRKENDAFERLFINRPLQKYAASLRLFVTSDQNFRSWVNLLKTIRSDVYESINCALQLVELLIVLRNGPLKGKNYAITSSDDLEYLADTTEKLLLDRLDESYEVLHNMDDIDDIADYTKEWDKALSIIPYREIIEFEELDYGGKRIELSALPYIKKDLESCIDIVNGFVLEADEGMTNRVIKWALKMKIPLNNEIYQDFYDFLDFYHLIPEAQKKAHMKSLDPYASRSYIRAKFNRAKQKS